MILEKVQFETNSAKILPQSSEILDAVAATLKGHPEFEVIEVGGHADERASDEHNLRLTKARAASVMAALRAAWCRRRSPALAGLRRVLPARGRLEPDRLGEEPPRGVQGRATEEGDTGVKRGCQRARSSGIVPPQPR